MEEGQAQDQVIPDHQTGCTPQGQGTTEAPTPGLLDLLSSGKDSLSLRRDTSRVFPTWA